MFNITRELIKETEQKRALEYTLSTKEKRELTIEIKQQREVVSDTIEAYKQNRPLHGERITRMMVWDETRYLSEVCAYRHNWTDEQRIRFRTSLRSGL